MLIISFQFSVFVFLEARMWHLRDGTHKKRAVREKFSEVCFHAKEIISKKTSLPELNSRKVESKSICGFYQYQQRKNIRVYKTNKEYFTFIV